MARRTKEDAEKTKASLLDAAEILFLRKGVASTTLDEIAREAGLTRGAVYWHFDNKMALFQAMIARVRQPVEHMYEEIFAHPDEDMVDGMKNLTLQTLLAVATDTNMRNVWTIIRLRCEQLYCSNDDYAKTISAQRQLALTRFNKVFKWAEKNGRLADGVAPEFASIALHSFFSGVFWDYLREPKTYKLNKLAPQLVDTFYSGITKPKK